MNKKNIIVTLILFSSFIFASDIKIKSDLRKSLKRMFSQNFDVDTTDVFVDIYHISKNMSSGKYRFLLKNTLRLGHQTLIATTNGTNRLPVTINAAIKKDIFIATRPVSYRKPLNSKDFELRKLLIDRNYNDYVVNFPLSANLETIRFIPEGTVLKNGMFDTKPYLQRGEIVQVKIRNGTITVKISGKTRNKGNIGDVIKVSLDNSRQTFSGTINSDKSILVELDK